MPVSVVLPAREVADTIGPIVEVLAGLRDDGVVDEVIVIDAASADGTGSVAAEQGASVYQRDEILPEHGPALGKGDAMWRGLSVANGDVVVFLDSDTRNFDASFVTKLIEPLLRSPDIHFVKAAFERPLNLADGTTENEGGRVTELVARPLIDLFFPELAIFRQPLAGEVAARRDLLETLQFPVGFGVEIAMLVDIWRAVGLEGMTEVDLGKREDRNKSLHELRPMATSVLSAALRRITPADRSDIGEAALGTAERPPLQSARAQ